MLTTQEACFGGGKTALGATYAYTAAVLGSMQRGRGCLCMVWGWHRLLRLLYLEVTRGVPGYRGTGCGMASLY